MRPTLATVGSWPWTARQWSRPCRLGAARCRVGMHAAGGDDIDVHLTSASLTPAAYARSRPYSQITAACRYLVSLRERWCAVVTALILTRNEGSPGRARGQPGRILAPSGVILVNRRLPDVAPAVSSPGSIKPKPSVFLRRISGADSCLDRRPAPLLTRYFCDRRFEAPACTTCWFLLVVDGGALAGYRRLAGEGSTSAAKSTLCWNRNRRAE